MARAGDIGSGRQEAWDGEQGSWPGAGQHTHKLGKADLGVGRAEEGLSHQGTQGREGFGGTSPGQGPEGSRSARGWSPEVHEASWFYQPGDSCGGRVRGLLLWTLTPLWMGLGSCLCLPSTASGLKGLYNLLKPEIALELPLSPGATEAHCLQSSTLWH